MLKCGLQSVKFGQPAGRIEGWLYGWIFGYNDGRTVETRRYFC